MSPCRLSIAKILVDRADEGGLWLEENLIVRVVGNRAARGDGCQPGAGACRTTWLTACDRSARHDDPGVCCSLPRAFAELR